jgi:hypothetical protein
LNEKYKGRWAVGEKRKVEDGDYCCSIKVGHVGPWGLVFITHFFHSVFFNNIYKNKSK